MPKAIVISRMMADGCGSVRQDRAQSEIWSRMAVQHNAIKGWHFCGEVFDLTASGVIRHARHLDSELVLVQGGSS
jgi:hypothetical protein